MILLFIKDEVKFANIVYIEGPRMFCKVVKYVVLQQRVVKLQGNWMSSLAFYTIHDLKYLSVLKAFSLKTGSSCWFIIIFFLLTQN